MKFKNREEFEKWLEDNKPIQFAQVLALRAALRVFPFAIISKNKDEIKNIARCLLVSSLACNFNDSESVRNATIRAGSVTYPSSVTNHNKDDYARISAAYSTRAYLSNGLEEQKRALYYAIDSIFFSNQILREFQVNEYVISDGEIVTDNAEVVTYYSKTEFYYDELSWDAEFLNDSKLSPEDAAIDLYENELWPFWLDNQYPPKLETAWQEAKTALTEDHPSWSVWIEWYEERLKGNPKPFATYVDDWNQGPLTIALKDDKFWQQDAPTINQAFINALTPKPPEPIHQIATATQFTQDPTQPTDIAPRSDRLGQTQRQRDMYDDFLYVYDQLRNLGHNIVGPLLNSELNRLNTLIDHKDISEIDPYRLWPRLNRFRTVFDQNSAVANNPDPVIAQLMPEVALQLKEFVQNINLYIICEPILVEIEADSKGVHHSDASVKILNSIDQALQNIINRPSQVTPEAKTEITYNIEIGTLNINTLHGLLDESQANKTKTNAVISFVAKVAEAIAISVFTDGVKELIPWIMESWPNIVQLIQFQVPKLLPEFMNYMNRIKDFFDLNRHLFK